MRAGTCSERMACMCLRLLRSSCQGRRVCIRLYFLQSSCRARILCIRDAAAQQHAVATCACHAMAVTAGNASGAHVQLESRMHESKNETKQEYSAGFMAERT